MSIRAIAAAFDIPDLSPAEKLLLLALADYADDYGCQIYPAIMTLARKTCLSRRSLQRHLESLAKRGLIESVAPPRHNRGTEYRLCLPELTRPQKEARDYDHWSPRLKLDLLSAFDLTCQHCHQRGSAIRLGPDGEPWHVDRLDPDRGYVRDNVTLSCASCNRGRRGKASDEIRSLAEAKGRQSDAPQGRQGDTRGVPGVARGGRHTDAPGGANGDTQSVSEPSNDPSVNPRAREPEGPAARRSEESVPDLPGMAVDAGELDELLPRLWEMVQKAAGRLRLQLDGNLYLDAFIQSGQQNGLYRRVVLWRDGELPEEGMASQGKAWTAVRDRIWRKYLARTGEDPRSWRSGRAPDGYPWRSIQHVDRSPWKQPEDS